MNPYTPPQADLASAAESTPRSIWWKLYFALVVLLQLLTVAVVLFYSVPQGLAYARFGSEPATATENLFSLALVAPLYAALYLYAFRSNDVWSARDSA